MITRRAFLSALAALPVVGKLIPQEIKTEMYPASPYYPATPIPFPEFDPAKHTFVVPSWDEVQRHYSDRYGAWAGHTHPRFNADVERLRAEWDRKYQA